MTINRFNPGQQIISINGPQFYGPRSLGGSTLIYDTFTDTNGVLLASHTIAPTNVPGATWSRWPGKNQIAINTDRAQRTAANPMNSIDVGVASYQFDVDLFAVNATVSVNQIWLRFTDLNNGWW